MRPLCLVESHSQDAAANAGMLSVYLATILIFSCSLTLKKRLYIVGCQGASQLGSCSLLGTPPGYKANKL